MTVITSEGDRPAAAAAVVTPEKMSTLVNGQATTATLLVETEPAAADSCSVSPTGLAEGKETGTEEKKCSVTSSSTTTELQSSADKNADSIFRSAPTTESVELEPAAMAPAYDDLPNVHNAYKALVSPNNSAECEEEAIEVVNDDDADFDEDDDDASTKSTSNLDDNSNKQQQQATIHATAAATTTMTTSGDSIVPADGESREQSNERENENSAPNEGSDRCETEGMTAMTTSTVPTVMEDPSKPNAPVAVVETVLEKSETVDKNEGANDRETVQDENELIASTPVAAEMDGTKQMEESLAVAVETVDEDSMLGEDQPEAATTSDTEWLNDLVRAHTPSKSLEEAEHHARPRVVDSVAADVQDVDYKETKRKDEPDQSVLEIVETKIEQEQEPVSVPMQQEATKDAHPVNSTPEVSLDQSPPNDSREDPEREATLEQPISLDDAARDKKKSPPLEIKEEWRELMGNDLMIKVSSCYWKWGRWMRRRLIVRLLISDCRSSDRR